MTTCECPTPKSLAAMTHCEHYYDETGPCCWCGSDEDEGDHPSCPAVNEAFAQSIEGQA